MSFFDFREEIFVNICVCIFERVWKINMFLIKFWLLFIGMSRVVWGYYCDFRRYSEWLCYFRIVGGVLGDIAILDREYIFFGFVFGFWL